MAVVVAAAVAVLEGWIGAVLHPRISTTVMAGKSRVGGGTQPLLLLIFGRFPASGGNARLVRTEET